ncbi:MAG: hypothetical protein M3209_03585 [Acidobacteriota bacterium]|nr:hypothetical protein [Acidobacteriota bacterium]
MKREKIGDYLSSVFYLLLAIWLLNSDFPEKYFSAFIVFLAAAQSFIHTIETDYCQRLSHRLSRVVLFLSLFLLIKVWFSI